MKQEEEDWARLKDLVKLDEPSAIRGDEMRDLILRLLSTPQGRTKIENGLSEALEGKVRAINRIVKALDERRDESGLSREDRIRLLERLSKASFPLKESKPYSYWSILWLRLEAGDSRIGKAVLEAMDRLRKGKKKSALGDQSLIGLDSWKHTPGQRRSDLLEAAIKEAESLPDLRRQLQEALRLQVPTPQPPAVQPGPKPTAVPQAAQARDGAGPDRPPPSKKPSGELTELPSPMVSQAENPRGTPLSPTSDATSMDRPPADVEGPVPVGHNFPQEVEQSATAGEEAPPSSDRTLPLTIEYGRKSEPAQDGTSPEEAGPRKKPRSRVRTGDDPPGSPLELSDPVLRVANMLADSLPRLDANLSALTAEVRGLGRRLASTDERSDEFSSLRDQLARAREALGYVQKSLDAALHERDRLEAELEGCMTRSRKAEDQARAAELRAEHHIREAELGRENAIQDYLASLRPDLRRILIDIGEPPPDEGASPPSETEVILWQRLREIKQTLKNHRVLLD
jgi:hypothetical protein